jgi:hypothetical protein
MSGHPELRRLLEEGKLDWGNSRHREAYLKYWLSQPAKQEEEESADERPAG